MLFIFCSDLVRAIEPCPEGLEVDFLRAGSYGAGTKSSGEVTVTRVLKTDVEGRHVILVGAVGIVHTSEMFQSTHKSSIVNSVDRFCRH